MSDSEDSASEYEVDLGLEGEFNDEKEDQVEIKFDEIDVTRLLGPSDKNQSVSAIYSNVEELCEIIGLKKMLPRLVFIGAESAGKSSLIEAFLGLPINYTAEQRATFAPIIFRIRRNLALKSRYHCVVEFNGKPKVISIEDLSETVRSINMKIRETTQVSLTPIKVNIECSDPSTRNFTIIDTPGVIKVDTDKEDGEDTYDKQEVVEKIRAIVKAVVRDGPEDLFVLVEKGTTPASQLDTFKLLVRPLDAKCDRTIPVMTHLDLKFNSDLGTTSDAERHLKEYNALYSGKSPYWVALHNISSTRRKEKGFDITKEEIHTQLKINTSKTKDWLKNFRPALNPEISKKVGIEGLKDHLEQTINQMFLKKARKVLNVFEDKKNEYLDQLKSSQSPLASSLHVKTISELLQDFIEIFDSYYRSAFRGLVPGDIQTEKISEIWNSGYTLEQEYMLMIRHVEWPENSLDNEEFSKYVIHADECLSTGSQRLERLKYEIGVRIMSIEPKDPENSEILNTIVGDSQRNVIDLNGSVAQLVRKAATKQFSEKGCDYMKERIYCILSSYAEVVLRLIKTQHGQFFENPTFSAAFQESVDRVFRVLVEKFASHIRKHVAASTASIRMDRPSEVELAYKFLYGFDEENTFNIEAPWRKKTERDREEVEDDTGSDRGFLSHKRLSREERMKAISNMKVSKDDIIQTPRCRELDQKHYDQAKYVFQRQFSLLRLEFWHSVENAILGHIQERIIGPPGVATLKSLLVSELLYDANDKSRKLTEDELDTKFNWKVHIQSFQERQERLKVVVSSLEKRIYEIRNTLDRLTNAAKNAKNGATKDNGSKPGDKKSSSQKSNEMEEEGKKAEDTKRRNSNAPLPKKASQKKLQEDFDWDEEKPLEVKGKKKSVKKPAEPEEEPEEEEKPTPKAAPKKQAAQGRKKNNDDD